MTAKIVDKESLLRQLRVMPENEAIAEMHRVLSGPGIDFALNETETTVADMIGPIELRVARMADPRAVPGFLELAGNLQSLPPDARLRNVYLETQKKRYCLTLTAKESSFVGCISFAKGGPRVSNPPLRAGTIEPIPITPSIETPDPEDPKGSRPSTDPARE